MTPYALPKLLQSAVKRVWRDTVDREGPRIAADYRTQLVGAIRNQTYKRNWQPLTENYVKYKERKKLDPRILIATGAYVRSIRWRKVGDSTWVVDVPNRRHSDDTGQIQKKAQVSSISFRRLAMIHERGSSSRNIPARPHWQPTTAKYQQDAPNTARKINARFMRDVQRAIQRGL